VIRFDQFLSVKIKFLASISFLVVGRRDSRRDAAAAALAAEERLVMVGNQLLFFRFQGPQSVGGSFLMSIDRPSWLNSYIPSLNLDLIGSARYYASSGPTRHGVPPSSA
jgi:hypothetical protein